MIDKMFKTLLISKKEISILNMFLVQFLNLGNKHRLKDEFNQKKIRVLSPQNYSLNVKDINE